MPPPNLLTLPREIRQLIVSETFVTSISPNSQTLDKNPTHASAYVSAPLNRVCRILQADIAAIAPRLLDAISPGGSSEPAKYGLENKFDLQALFWVATFCMLQKIVAFTTIPNSGLGTGVQSGYLSFGVVERLPESQVDALVQLPREVCNGLYPRNTSRTVEDDALAMDYFKHVKEKRDSLEQLKSEETECENKEPSRKKRRLDRQN
ncbi:uncharacterized protein BDZ99DRAFT_528380 [Mytilinidion resinicola]|uniref:Uncharacterized protein n=1 Tax=Mytilinidion resinicola TaxID=574789 RepID=A0A6A6XYE0_9PEZI|nr:uncharacterized protein BDZ99DRAFT_528380 [Mytilinidion resinicola]KAF2801430.1 hypothetical protein BDZ99DRAFT_528380 [Mytilinidion resinicola]